MDHEEYKRKALEPIINYIESVMASYSKEELEARIKKALPEKEGEDERIRKRLVEYFNGFYDRFSSRNNVNVHWEGLEVKAVIAYLEKQKEQGSTNSEKPKEWRDADMREARQNLIVCCRDWEHGENTTLLPIVATRARYFLEHLTEPKTAEWSEEDEDTIEKAICVLEANFEPNEEFTGLDIKRYQLVDRLKSLRPQLHWKPSEEQLDALLASYTKDEGVYDYYALESLYNDLKKLM